MIEQVYGDAPLSQHKQVGGGVGGRMGGGHWKLGQGVSQRGGCARPTTTTCIPQGGGGVSRGMGV